MAVSKTERRVFLWRLGPRPIPIEAQKTVTLAEILGLLREEYVAKRARAFLSTDARILEDNDPDCNPKHQLYVAEMKESQDGRTVTVLFNRGDPNTVSPGFIDFDTSEVRIEHPNNKESPGWSAHLVIDQTSTNGVHKACFEQMTKVSGSLVIAAVDKIVSRAAAAKNNYFFVHKVGRGKKIKEETRAYRPYLSLGRVPSEKLEDDLKQGYLSSVTLTKKESFYQGPGRERYVTKQEHKVKITTRQVDNAETVGDFISGVISRGRDDGYEEITFAVAGLPGGQTKNATLSLDEADAMEALYVRAHRVSDFKNILDGCYRKVCEDIMIDLLFDKPRWRES